MLSMSLSMSFSDPSPWLAQRGGWYRVYEGDADGTHVVVSFMVYDSSGRYDIDVAYGDDVTVRFATGAEPRVLEGLRGAIPVPPGTIERCREIVDSIGEDVSPG